MDRTPQHLTFSTGEPVYASRAVYAIATPFVQGRLRKQALSVTVRTECAHCSKPLEMAIDSDLACEIRDEGCEPVAFIPDVDLLNLDEENIINAF